MSAGYRHGLLLMVLAGAVLALPAAARNVGGAWPAQPTEPYPTLPPTRPFPTLPSSVPTPVLYTATPTGEATEPTEPTPTGSGEPSATATATATDTPSPTATSTSTATADLTATATRSLDLGRIVHFPYAAQFAGLRP